MTADGPASWSKPGEVPHQRAAPGRVTMQKAILKMYTAEPAPGGSKTGEPSSAFLEFQFNPKEVTIAKTAKWERKPAKGAQDRRSAGVQRRRSVQADPGDVLRRDLDPGRGAVVTAVEQLFSCCVPTEKSQVKKKPSPPLVVLHWGKVRSFASFVTSVSAKYTLFSADGMPHPSGLQRGHGGDAGRAVQAEPDLGWLRRPPGAPHGGRRLAGLDRLRRVRRPHDVATAGRASTGSTTRCACRWAPSLTAADDPRS